MGKSPAATKTIVNLAKNATQFAKEPKSIAKVDHRIIVDDNNNNNNKSKNIIMDQPMINSTSGSSSNSNSSQNNNDKNNNNSEMVRLPLSDVVSDCAKRWFKDTLKEAKSGEINMQVLVAQMYSSGYGVPRDDKKGRMWITRASKVRSSAWKVSDKPPGYTISDSDSEADS